MMWLTCYIWRFQPVINKSDESESVFLTMKQYNIS